MSFACQTSMLCDQDGNPNRWKSGMKSFLSARTARSKTIPGERKEVHAEAQRKRQKAQRRLPRAFSLFATWREMPLVALRRLGTGSAGQAGHGRQVFFNFANQVFLGRELLEEQVRGRFLPHLGEHLGNLQRELLVKDLLFQRRPHVFEL